MSLSKISPNIYCDGINDRHQYSKQLPIIFGIDVGGSFSPSLKQLLQYVHSEDRNLVNDTVQNGIMNRSVHQIEYRLLRRDQTVRCIYEQAEILLDKNGHLDGFVGYIQDITDSKISSHDLANQFFNSEQFYCSLFENSLGMVIYIDAYGTIAKTNDKFFETLRYSVEDIVLCSIKRFLPSSEIAIFNGFYNSYK